MLFCLLVTFFALSSSELTWWDWLLTWLTNCCHSVVKQHAGFFSLLGKIMLNKQYIANYKWLPGMT